ncbi:tryptophan-rich sensory protein [Pseudolysobacter antarcticus]|uniref:Tryptophan-rich sensory protein n=1 Tax=Pseudolysobacter antarcticus TaxID=2511995 RepID=A0A411HKU7_9GAMM|nr:TspO/MBR family protein [Pseudolysobacter antarcticus]QBB71007.1 tryptophan-rich sensory protein [Pseudolysobacter antarcticus]
MPRQWKSLALWLLLSFLVAGVASMFMPDAWYAALQKPEFNPPNWVFAPVWTLLYILMAIAVWRVQRKQQHLSFEIALWLLQLLLNGLWSWLFFGLHRPDLALIDIALLIIVLLTTVLAFARVDRIAAWLLLPYLAWVSFASMLNLSLWQLNP